MKANVDSVIVAFRSEDIIQDAVRRTQDLGGQVVVVDHGDGRSAARAEALGALTLLDPANPGFGCGQNRGVRATTSPFVLLCNPDAAIEPAAVKRGIAFLFAHPSVAAVQGVIVNRHTGEAERSQGVELGPLHLLGRAVGARRLLRFSVARRLASCSSQLRDHVERIPPGPTEVETLAATAILIRRTAFDEVGGFDPAYFLYGEDMDLCRRLRLRGWKLVAMPEVWARHLNGSSSESNLVQELHWWTGTMIFASRWWTPTAWAVAMCAATLRASALSLVVQPLSLESLRALVAGPMLQRIRRPCPTRREMESVEGKLPAAPDRGALDRISVVIRCHEQGRFLAHAVDSVRSQSRPADEIVVVDDGSSDETQRVLKSLERFGPLLVIRHPEPLGPAESFNAGVRASSGDLVLALDADDALSRRYLELSDGSVQKFGSESSLSPARDFDAEELGVENFLHVSTIFRRWIFEQCGGFRTDLDHLGLEDWEFWINAVEQGAQGTAVEHCALHYRRHEHGSRNCISHWSAIRIHLRVHRLHPRVVTRRHLARWFARSLQRNLHHVLS